MQGSPASLERWCCLPGASQLSGVQLLQEVFWMCLAGGTEPPESREGSCLRQPWLEVAAFPLRCCLGLVRSQGEEVGQRLSRRHPLGQNHLPVRLAPFSAAEGCCQSSDWNSPVQPGPEAPARARGFPLPPPANTFTLSTQPYVASLCASPPFNSLACIFQKP